MLSMIILLVSPSVIRSVVFRVKLSVVFLKVVNLVHDKGMLAHSTTSYW